MLDSRPSGVADRPGDCYACVKTLRREVEAHSYCMDEPLFVSGPRVIVRSWRGRTPHNRAESYARHFMYVVLPRLQSLQGFAGGTLLRRAVGDETEFLVLTSWESMDAVKLFAGDTPDVAVVDADARALLSTFDTTVDHWSST